MWSKVVAAATGAAFVCSVGLSGCAITDASVGERMQDINQSVDVSVNTSILLNIVRASKSQPLNFVTLAKVSGSQLIDLKTGLPTLTFGPNLSASQRQFSFGNNMLDNNASTSFDVAIMGSKDFYKGLMTPLTEVDVNLLIRQGFPRELLFHLVIDSIRYSPSENPKIAGCVMKNDPSDESYEEFLTAIRILMAQGATIETRDELNPKRPPNSGKSSSGGKESSSNEPYAVTGARICFDPSLQEEPLYQKSYGKPSDIYYCRGKWARAALECTNRKTEDLFDDGSCKGSKGERKKNTSGYRLVGAQAPFSPACLKNVMAHGAGFRDFVVETRSIYGVFNYLGHLLERGDQVRFQSKEAHGLLPDVQLGQAGGCFTSVNYQGQGYCVPASPAAERTKQAFAILGQLVALKTAAGDLPNTPTVRVTP